MIVRIIVVDPQPAAGRSDLLVYQVPENSREFAVLIAVFKSAGLEWETIGPNRARLDKETQNADVPASS